MTKITPNGIKTDTQETNQITILAPFVLSVTNFFFASNVGLAWFRPLLPLLPDEHGSVPFAMILGGAMGLVFNARPAKAADWGRIVLFFLILDVGGLLLLMAGAALTRHTGLDPWDGYGIVIGASVGLGFLYLLSDFLMRRGLVPGCPSWRELRRRQKAERQPYSEHYQLRHWLAGLVTGLVVVGLAWPLLAWLGGVTMLYMLNPLTAQPLAMGMGLFAGITTALSRPPDGGTWLRTLFAALLAALLFPVFLIALDESAIILLPPAAPDELRSLAGLLISIFAAFVPSLAMVGIAALRLGGLPAGPDAKPDGEATPAATRPNRRRPLSFDHAVASAILFLSGWAGVYGLLEYLSGAIPTYSYPPMAALVMGLAAGALPLVVHPSGAKGWAYVSAALLLALAVMPATLVALTFAIRAWLDPLPDIHTILAVTHFGPLLPALAILATTAWMQGRHRTKEEGEP